MSSVSNKKPRPANPREGRAEVYELDEFENARTWVFQSDVVPRETRLPSVMVEPHTAPPRMITQRPFDPRPAQPVEPPPLPLRRPKSSGLAPADERAARQSRTMLPPAMPYPEASIPVPPAKPPEIPRAPAEWKSHMAFVVGAASFVGALFLIMESPPWRAPTVEPVRDVPEQPEQPAEAVAMTPAAPVEPVATVVGDEAICGPEGLSADASVEPETPVTVGPPADTAKAFAEPVGKQKRKRTRRPRSANRPLVRKLTDTTGSAAGATAASDSAREGWGRLNLISFPSGDVFEGPNRLGSTPLIGLKLPEGEHRLFIRAGELGQVVFVDIVAGEVTKHRVRWAPPEE